MRKPPISLVIGTAMGLLLGSAIRYFSEDSPASDPTVAEKPLPTREIEPVPITIASRIDRPTQEEVLRLSGYNDAEVLARYLEDATIDEIIALMDPVVRGETSLYDMRWMIEMRGLELNHEAMLAWARSQKRGRFDDLSSLLKTWASMDPEAALNEEFQEHSSLSWHVTSGMLDGDLETAIAAIKAVYPDSPILMEFNYLRWAEMAKTNAPAALKEAMDIESSEERGNSLKSIIYVWAERDALAAVQWLENQEDLEHSNTLLSLGLRKLADTRPDLAWRKLDGLQLIENRSYLESEIISKWANQDSEAALALAKDLPAGLRRDHILGSIGESFEGAPEDFFALMKELKIDMSNGSIESESFIKLNANSRVQLNESAEILYSSAREAAMELAKESPKEALIALRSVGVNGVNEVAEIWVESDPNAAAKWAAGLPESDFATGVQEAVFRYWGAKSPEAAAASLVANELTENVGLSSALANQWVQQDAESAINWASALKGNGRDQVLSAALSWIASSDPAQALQHVNQIEDSRAQMKILQRATHSWRLRDPEGVMTWLQSQPPEAALDRIVMDTVEGWVSNQPQLASEWIASMEPGPRKDQAVAGIVGALISPNNPSKDFSAAETWAQTINDPELRQQRLAEINALR